MQRRTFLNLAASGLAGAYAQQLATASDLPIAQRAKVPVPGILTVGRRKQRFLDDELIAARSRLSKFMGRPDKKGPVIAADRPWESDSSEAGGYSIHGVQISGQAVLFDEDEQVFKMWYNPWAFFEKRLRPWCYAISKDGLHWEKPNLGIYSYQGSKDNNILWAIDGAKYFNVMKDVHEPDPQKRFKALGEEEGKGKGGLAIAFSLDGLHWTEHPGNPVVPKGRDLADCPTMLGWDERIRKYVYYPRPGPPLASRINGRGYHESPDRVNLNDGQLRTIGYSTSEDFIHWSPSQLMLAPDEDDRVDFQYYQMTVAREGDHYIGLMHMLQTHEQTFDIFLLTSRDGFHWNWVHRDLPFLRRGEVGSFDDGYLTPSGPIVLKGQVWIYYGAYSGAHSAERNKLGANTMTIALATLPADRYVGLLAGPDMGTLVTRPMVFSGSRLKVDMDASLPGKATRKPTQRKFDEADLRVEVLDEWGGRIEGLQLDQCRTLVDSGVHEVTWKDRDLAAQEGTPVRLKFEYRNAALYGFQFE